MPLKFFQIVGVLGTATLLSIFIASPSFPTPDKIFILLCFVFMIFGRGLALLKRLAPFVVLLLVYELFRGIADGLNTRVEYQWMIDADRWLFGGTLPTTTLQNWLWNGQVQWYDFFLYAFYILHFVLPVALALLVWKYREKFYWKYVTSFVVVCFLGFFTFVAFPAAPPWMASDEAKIEPITRISSDVWFAMGIRDFPSFYSKISPNPVAAVPSLHAAFATLFTIWIFKLFRWRWGALSLIYPLSIYFGTVYQGEHYAIDEIIGAGYAFFAYFLTMWAFWYIYQNRASSNSAQVES